MFALGALGIAIALSLGTYFLARQSLVEQRERVALRQALSDAALVRSRLLTSGEEVSDALGDLSPPPGTTVFLKRSNEWYSSSLDLRAEEVTSSVQSHVSGGSVAQGWTGATGVPAVVVGIPLPAVGAEYFEVSVADELDRTLGTLRLALLVCAAVTVTAGVILGRWASARSLVPLKNVTQVAARISGGDMDARLRDTDDPDLATLVGAFNNMVDTVVERIHRDARFAADVSHELRTPLTTLITSFDVLRTSRELSSRDSQAVQLMSRELERFRLALEDLLVLGRLDADRPRSEASSVGVGQLVRQALINSDRSPDLLERSEADQDPIVTVEPSQMIRALTNLFDNADVHGGGLSRVGVVRRDASAEIHVEDRGPGVPEEDRERVFERFVRTGPRGSGPGVGLGLSIVARTAQIHGGTAWCTERPGGGADFVIRLPLTQVTG